MANADGTHCASCGQPMPPKKGRGRPPKYCSNACRPPTQRATKTKQYVPVDRSDETQWCDGCGEQFHYHRKCKYCSVRCRTNARQQRRNPDSTVGEISHCLRCGKQYTRRAINQIACSKRCSKRLWCRSDEGKASQAKRNAFKRAVTLYDPNADHIDVWEVFERDGWRCQICGKNTPKSRRGTKHKNAPEVDHRIPLSRGGTHTYGNVQCACHACNRSKSNRNEVGQYPLLSIESA